MLSSTRLIPLIAVTAGLFLAAPLHADLQATATLTITQQTSGLFRYSVLLTNTGNTPIGTLWLGWANGQNLMSSTPSNVTAPANWQGTVLHTQFGGYGVGWTSPLTAYTLPAKQVLSGFGFDSAMTPDQFLAAQAGRGIVFIGAPFGDDGYILTATTAADTQPQFLVTVSHVGSFTQGQTGVAFTITLQNSGSAPTSGTVTVTDLYSPGLTPTSIAGLGWTCTLPNTTCTRQDPLPAGSGYPPIRFIADVALGTPTPVLSQVNVTGGGAQVAMATDSATVLQPFTDIAQGDSYLPAINLMREYGITSGCGSSPPIYCPSANATRGEMAVFLIRAILGSDNFTATAQPYFTDVPTFHPLFKWIQKLRDLGITTGCTTTTFCPGDLVTRAQLAVFLIRARFNSPSPFLYPTAPSFTDVPSTSGFYPWIQKMKQVGITTGCTATTYCPDDPVTRAQIAVFLMRGMFNMLLPQGTPYIAFATPSVAPRGMTSLVTLTGQNTNWVQGTTVVTATPGITIGNVTVSSPTQMTVQVTVAPTANLGPYSIDTVTGLEDATLPNAFIVQ